MKLINMRLVPDFYYSIFLSPKYSPEHCVLRHPVYMLRPSWKQQVKLEFRVL